LTNRPRWSPHKKRQGICIGLINILTGKLLVYSHARSKKYQINVARSNLVGQGVFYTFLSVWTILFCAMKKPPINH
jgi:hypothetical protein